MLLNLPRVKTWRVLFWDAIDCTRTPGQELQQKTFCLQNLPPEHPEQQELAIVRGCISSTDLFSYLRDAKRTEREDCSNSEQSKRRKKSILVTLKLPILSHGHSVNGPGLIAMAVLSCVVTSSPSSPNGQSEGTESTHESGFSLSS
jgi:hypothetical protein